MSDDELMRLMARVDPQTRRIPPGVRAIANAAEAAERARWNGVVEYLHAAADGSMSRNNSQQLAYELLAVIQALQGNRPAPC